MKYLIILALLQVSIIFSACNTNMQPTSFAITINNDTYSIVKYTNGTYKIRPFGKNEIIANTIEDVMIETIFKYDKNSNFTFYKRDCKHYENDVYYAQKVLYQLLENNPAMCEDGLLTLY